MKQKTNKIGEEEILKVYLSKDDHPIAYKKKLDELINSGLSEDDAKKFIETTPFFMEVYYSENQGLFLVETEAVDAIDIYNPYDGTLIEKIED